MKLTTGVCVVLLMVGMHCVHTANVAVGLYAPDRYDGIPEMCLMPMDFGYCRAKVKRYYFDMRRMKCTMFYWGGCAGNINNFKSMEECNKVCFEAYDQNKNSRQIYNADNADDINLADDNDDNNNNYKTRGSIKNSKAKINNNDTNQNNGSAGYKNIKSSSSSSSNSNDDSQNTRNPSVDRIDYDDYDN